MFDLKVKVDDTTKRVKDAADKASFKNLGHAAASIRKDVLSTVDRAKGPSAPGRPVHTRKGLAKRALQFSVSKDTAVIGFAASVIGQAMSAHEHGGEYKGHDYPERPTVFPGLERAAPRLADQWKGTIGE